MCGAYLPRLVLACATFWFTASTAQEPSKVRWPEAGVLVGLGGLFYNNDFQRAFAEAGERWDANGRFVFHTAIWGSGYEGCRPLERPVVRVGVAAYFNQQTCTGPFSPEVLAITQNVYNPQSGYILKSEIVFNANLRWSVYDTPWMNPDMNGIADFRRVAIHEFGHLAGLQHEPQPDSIMYPDATNVVKPSGADLDRLRHLYSDAPTFPDASTKYRFQCRSGAGPSIELGSISTGTYSENCVDFSRMEVVYRFSIPSVREHAISLGASRTEVNLEVKEGDKILCSESNQGTLSKKCRLTLQAGAHTVRVWREVAGSHFSLAIEPQ